MDGKKRLERLAKLRTQGFLLSDKEQGEISRAYLKQADKIQGLVEALRYLQRLKIEMWAPPLDLHPSTPSEFERIGRVAWEIRTEIGQLPEWESLEQLLAAYKEGK